MTTIDRVKAIIFDCEGVIIDTETIWDKGQEEFLHRRGFVYDRSRIKHLLTGTSMQDGVMIMQKEYGFSGNIVEQADERIAIVRTLFAREIEFIAGFRDFFSLIKSCYKTCIATAMPFELFQLVDKRLHLTKLFEEHIYTLSNVNFRAKPHPDLFLYAANQLKITPEHCLVIEDAPHGIEAAKRAGMKSVGITTTYSKKLLVNKGADWVVDSFAEMSSMITSH